MMRENAASFFEHHNQPILAEQAEEEESNIISVLECHSFHSLCSITDVSSTNEIGFIKLLDYSQEQLITSENQIIDILRIQGTAFPDQQSLKKFVKMYQKLNKFDHRLLGPRLGLFHLFHSFNPLEVFWTAKGTKLLNQLKGLWFDIQNEQDIQMVSTPQLNPFIGNERQIEFPNLIFGSHSYKLISSQFVNHLHLLKDFFPTEIPYRIGEFAKNFQKLHSAQMWGLFQSYSYWSDLVTIYCYEKQLYQELIYSLQFIQKVVRILGFKINWYLIGREGYSKGSFSLDQLKQALNAEGLEYSFAQSKEETRLQGMWVDCLEREWKGPSVSIIKSKAGESEPIILARTLFGSLDAVIALLLEQSDGELPFWLVPEQLRILSIGEKGKVFAESVNQVCRQHGYRTTLDLRDEKLSLKVHEAEKEKIPFLVLIGDKEASKNLLTVRSMKNREMLVDIEQLLKILSQTNTIGEETNLT